MIILVIRALMSSITIIRIARYERRISQKMKKKKKSIQLVLKIRHRFNKKSKIR